MGCMGGRVVNIRIRQFRFLNLINCRSLKAPIHNKTGVTSRQWNTHEHETYARRICESTENNARDCGFYIELDSGVSSN
eukprot:scaffold7186_cov52-Attheya_sp.AAC.2